MEHHTSYTYLIATKPKAPSLEAPPMARPRAWEWPELVITNFNKGVTFLSRTRTLLEDLTVQPLNIPRIASKRVCIRL